jgi:hypothetical protein
MEPTNANSSAILKLQVLETEFNLVMKQYEREHLNYISTLQSQGVLEDDNMNCNEWANRNPSECSVNPNYMLSMCKKSCKNFLENKTKFVSLQGRVFWGTAGLKEGAVDSEESCKALCSNDPLCTGATYNSAKSYCWTRSGKGDIAVGKDEEYALISEVTQSINNINQLNNRLTDLNQKIEKTLTEIIPEEQSQIEDKNSKQTQLKKVYQQLLADRKNIEQMLKEYKMLDQQYADNSIYVEQNSTAYMLWFIFAILVVFFTLKLQFFPEVKSNPVRFIFWFCITILFVIVTTHINEAPGFFLWGAIITMVAFMQMNILPSP